MSRGKELLRNSISLGIGTVTSKLITFLLVPLYSRWLAPNDYGTFDLISTYISLFVPFITLQLEQALYRYCVEDPENSSDYYYAVMKLVMPLVIVVSTSVYVVLGYIFKKGYALSFSLYIATFALYNIHCELLRGERKLRLYSLINVVYSAILIVLTVLLIGVLRCGLDAMLFTYALSYGICSLLILQIIKPSSSNMSAKSSLRSMLRFSIPLIPNSISWWISNVSNRTFINIYIGSFANGLYAVACKIPTVVSMIFGVFNMAFQQTAISSIDDRDRKSFFTDIMCDMIKMLTCGCMVIIMLTGPYYEFLIDGSYYSGVYCVPFLLQGTIFLALAQYLGDILLALKRTSSIGTSTVLSAVLTIAINVMLVPTFGIIGAALGTLLAYLTMFVVRFRILLNEINALRVIESLVKWTLVFCITSVLCLSTDVLSSWYLLLSAVVIFVVVKANLPLIKKVVRSLRGV